MNKLFISIVIAFIAIAGALLFQASRTGTSMVLTPTELLQSGQAGKSLTRIRVGGKVAQADIEYKVEPSIALKFSIQDPGVAGASESQPKLVPVVYNGIKPDMFATGRDIIIDGDYVGGVLVASKLLTQCPSKYEPPSADKQYPHKN